MKKFILTTLTVLLVISLYGATLRGRLGNPSASSIDNELSQSGAAFETSQERSRYALILALVNNHRLDLGEYASMGTPDIGRVGDKYYSFFPPATSILAIPLYLLGVQLGAAQIWTFLISTLFAALTMLVLYRLSLRLKLAGATALFVALAFGFATNAWGYSVTLYAHLLSAFALVGGVALASHRNFTWAKSLGVWLLYAFAIFVDFPNIFAFFPIALVAGLRSFQLVTTKTRFTLSLRPTLLIGVLLFLAAMCGYGYYNYHYFGHPLKLSNTIDRVKDLKVVTNSSPEVKNLSAAHALSPRKLIVGLTSFSVSHDRGLLIYTPVALLFVFGLASLLKRSNLSLKLLLIGVPLTNLLTYSMFGDPYGGWAFGSRYMIAILPELLVIAGLGLDYFARHANRLLRVGVLVVYSLVTLYSAGMSLLAPLTTNVIPPTIEAGTFALADDYRIPLEMLRLSHLNSFVYNRYLSTTLTGQEYYYLIYIPLALVLLLLIWRPRHSRRDQ